MPNNLTALTGYTFTGCQNVKISDFSKITEIGPACFQGAGSGDIGPDVTHILFNGGINFDISYPPFRNYGKTGILQEVKFIGITSEVAEQKASTAGFSGVSVAV